MSRVSKDILDVAVIGAGGAGLGVSYFLKQAGLDHLVLERSRIGDTWLRQRWDSFRLNSPNVRSMLPGDTYEGAEPLGAMTHHEFVAYLNAYVERNGLPGKTELRRAAIDPGKWLLPCRRSGRSAPGSQRGCCDR